MAQVVYNACVHLKLRAHTAHQPEINRLVMAHPLVDSKSLDAVNPLAALIPGLAPQLAAATSFLRALLLATIFATM